MEDSFAIPTFCGFHWVSYFQIHTCHRQVNTLGARLGDLYFDNKVAKTSGNHFSCIEVTFTQGFEGFT